MVLVKKVVMGIKSVTTVHVKVFFLALLSHRFKMSILREFQTLYDEAKIHRKAIEELNSLGSQIILEAKVLIGMDDFFLGFVY